MTVLITVISMTGILIKLLSNANLYCLRTEFLTNKLGCWIGKNSFRCALHCQDSHFLAFHPIGVHVYFLSRLFFGIRTTNIVEIADHSVVYEAEAKRFDRQFDF